MKRSTKITTIIIIFFIIIAVVIGGRYAMKIHFQKKFGKRPPPAIIVAIVKNENFYQKLETYGTALSNKTTTFRIKKTELLESINFNQFLFTFKSIICFIYTLNKGKIFRFFYVTAF